MNELINVQLKTMSSVELVEIINQYRKFEGNNTSIRHIDFMVKVEKEIGYDCEIFRSEYKASNNQTYKCFDLPKDECMLMLMSESRTVRKGVLNKLNELEKSNPNYENALLVIGVEASLVPQIAKVYYERDEMRPKVIAFENVIDSQTTYTLDSVSDILNIGRTTLSKILENKKWKTIKEQNGTSSTRYSEENGYAKTIFEYIKIGNKEIKSKRIVIKKKGLDKLIKDLNNGK